MSIFRDVDFWKFLTGKSKEEEKKDEKPADKKSEEEKDEDKEEEHPITLRRW
jgi:hypothetical protein